MVTGRIHQGLRGCAPTIQPLRYIVPLRERSQGRGERLSQRLGSRGSSLAPKPLLSYIGSLTLESLPVPAVRICESRPGAAGDPQLRPRGVGRYQVSGRFPWLWPRSAPSVGGPPPFAWSSAGWPGRVRASLEVPPRALPVAAALPRSGTGTRRGGAAGAGLRGREPRKGAPRGHHGFPTRPERGNALPALPDSAGRAAPTRTEPRGSTRASERFLRPEALETNGRLRLLYDLHTWHKLGLFGMLKHAGDYFLGNSELSAFIHF